MAAVPLTAFWIMPLGMLALLLMPAGLQAAALVPMGWGEDAVLWIARTVSALPEATLPVPAMPGWGLVMVALGMAWLGLWRTRVRLAGLPVLAAGLLSPLLVRPPDMLVSADARLIGLRTPAGMFVESARGASSFERDAWQEFWDDGSAQRLPELGVAANGAVTCDAVACRWQTLRGAMALIARVPPDLSACRASVVLAARPVRLRCTASVPVIDRFSVWREGAHAVWLDADGVRIVSERAVRGERPWAPPPGAGRSTAGLVMAPTEPLPPE
jgi:competence protein ComEC